MNNSVKKIITITLEGNGNSMGFLIDAIGNTLNFLKDDCKDIKINMKIEKEMSDGGYLLRGEYLKDVQRRLR